MTSELFHCGSAFDNIFIYIKIIYSFDNSSLSQELPGPARDTILPKCGET